MPYFFISRHIVVRLTCSSRAAAPISPPWRASVATIISRSARSRAAVTVPSAQEAAAARRHALPRADRPARVRAARDRDRALHDVLELTDVARIVVRREQRPARLRCTVRRRSGAVLAEKMLDQQPHDLPPRSRSGGMWMRCTLQAIVEIAAKLARRRPPPCRSTLVAATNRTSTRRLVVLADPAHLAGLERAQQLRLQRLATSSRSRRGTACRPRVLDEARRARRRRR